MKNSPKPTLYDRTIIWLFTHVPRMNFIIQHGLAEAYDRGYSSGIVQGSKINGKTSTLPYVISSTLLAPENTCSLSKTETICCL